MTGFRLNHSPFTNDSNSIMASCIWFYVIISNSGRVDFKISFFFSGAEKAYGVLVFDKTLVVTGQGNHEQQTLYSLETVYPFLSLGPLAADVHHAEVYLAQFKEGFGDTGSAQSRVEHILIVGQPIGGEDAVQGIIVAGRG